MAGQIVMWDEMQKEIKKAFDEGYDKGWKEATKVGIHEAHKYQ